MQFNGFFPPRFLAPRLSFRRITTLPFAGCKFLAVVGCSVLFSGGLFPGIGPAHGQSTGLGPSTLTSVLVATNLKGLETFDTVWETIERTHFDPNLGGVDWEGVRDELRPQAAETSDREDLRNVIREMLSRLGKSHFQLIPRETYEEGRGVSDREGWLGLDLRFSEDEVLIARVEDGGSAAKAGVRAGWILKAVDGRSVEEIGFESEGRGGRDLRAHKRLRNLRRALRGEVGEFLRLRLLDGRDRERRLELALEKDPRDTIKTPGLPPLRATFEFRELTPVDPQDSHRSIEIGLIRFGPWLPPLLPEIESALEELHRTDGLVLDLRGNPGGVGQMALRLGENFFRRAASLGTFRRRYGSRPFEMTDPVDDPYLGPVAILTDEMTGSTSEVFAAGMQGLGRARIFGGRTAGAALPAIQRRLPNGDYLMHAVADFIPPQGESLEGVGVLPDVPVKRTRANLLAGRDEVLERAIEWIQGKTREY